MKRRQYHVMMEGEPTHFSDFGAASSPVNGRSRAVGPPGGRSAYEATGRLQQKARTRALLVEQARRLMAHGPTPSVADVAAAARVSRATAYRYFPRQIDLVRGAYPEIDALSLLPDPAPQDVPARVDAVLDEHFRILLKWEPQLRAALRLSLDGDQQPILRGGRAIRWIRDALDPLRRTHPRVDLDRLAVQLRAAAGIEPYVWLVDVAKVPAWEAVQLMRATVGSVLGDAMKGPAAEREQAR